MRHEKAPPRETMQTGEEPYEYGELCIRVMEKVMEGVMAEPRLKDHFDTIFGILMDVVQDELKPYAYQYAYELFSDEWVVRSRRRAFEEEAAQAFEQEKAAH